MFYKSLAKPLLFLKDAESAHEIATNLATITSNSAVLQTITKRLFGFEHSRLEKEFWGLKFRSPVGLAAGFDKNGETPLAMQSLGFGFIEIGSITAKPSAGNPKPRAFRLPGDYSIINRMGLNNQGAKAVVKRLSDINLKIPLGINIAKTNDSTIHGDKAIEDYLFSYELANEIADYITINISCPNTGEGKTFEDPDALESLLAGLEISKEKRRPSLVKFSVDTDKKTLSRLVEICEKYSVSGYVATNTSSKRDGLITNLKYIKNIGNGGLSGRAISQKSTEVVRWLYDILKGSKPIIGVGGIDSVESAKQKLDAGADLLQIYTGMIYEGPSLIKTIKKGLII